MSRATSSRSSTRCAVMLGLLLPGLLISTVKADPTTTKPRRAPTSLTSTSPPALPLIQTRAAPLALMAPTAAGSTAALLPLVPTPGEVPTKLCVDTSSFPRWAQWSGYVLTALLTTGFTVDQALQHRNDL